MVFRLLLHTDTYSEAMKININTHFFFFSSFRVCLVSLSYSFSLILVYSWCCECVFFFGLPLSINFQQHFVDWLCACIGFYVHKIFVIVMCIVQVEFEHKFKTNSNVAFFSRLNENKQKCQLMLVFMCWLLILISTILCDKIGIKSR